MQQRSLSHCYCRNKKKEPTVEDLQQKMPPLDRLCFLDTINKHAGEILDLQASSTKESKEITHQSSEETGSCIPTSHPFCDH
ncbi:hypothetical protein AOLI_G00243810 [Acnodon oligacanthus]